MTAVPLLLTDRPTSTLPAPARGCDCRTCPWYSGSDAHPGHTVAPLCSGRNTDCSYCGCARTEGLARSAGNPCGTCSIRCGSRTDIQAWMRDVGGTLEFDDITFTTSALPAGLPRFIPQVDGSGTAQLHAAAQWPAYAVGLRRVFSPATHRLYPRFAAAAAAGDDARTVLGLPPGPDAAQTVLVGYGEDPLVEAFWTLRHSERLLHQVAALRFDVVLAPNFSLYGSYPRAEMLLNLRRNLVIAAELNSLGVTAVPNLYGFRVEDWERYITWLDDLGPDAPPGVAMNLQTFRTEEDWDAMAAPALHFLAVALPADMPVFLTGPSRPDRVQLLVELFGPRLHLISQNPQQYAQHGALMTHEGRVDVHADKTDLFTRNTRFIAELLT